MASLACITEDDAIDYCLENGIDPEDNIEHVGVVYVVKDTEKFYPEDVETPEPTPIVTEPDPVKQDKAKKKEEPVGVPIEDNTKSDV